MLTVLLNRCIFITISIFSGKIKDVHLPSFVDFDNLLSYHLCEEGVQQLHKILAILQHTNPDITHSPLLYPLLSLFLHYMEASDAYNCVYGLLTAKETFIVQTKVAHEASKRVLRDLTKKFAVSNTDKLLNIIVVL